MIHFTADLHFGHANVIRFCNRPFENVECMERGLIDRWNNQVKPSDDVYVLGDLAFQKPTTVVDILYKLNGHIHLVPGNHDSKQLLRTIADMMPPKVIIEPQYLELNYQSRKFVLCHYPFESWNNMSHGAIHLHGHSHGNSRQVPNRWDVGVDAMNYTPVAIDYFIQASKEMVPRPDRVVLPPTV